eukprot:CAMPEP_0185035810 /NCGR_PEP_ID=MMETSP1103-20130426/27826_1 /TAXON_ID=36769 /ORGANISM="Paraphysomonas bandaiensis, Strain Caron Lab Isolate" /LENGTH=546 /DNA_ID=CAMNT_0027573071 /DNA_START=119 /DNA_END=1759 /DNA_ORIENTATION=-
MTTQPPYKRDGNQLRGAHHHHHPYHTCLSVERPSLVLPADATIVYCTSAEEVSRGCQRVTQSAGDSFAVWGFDCEWKVDYIPGRMNPVALIQLYRGKTAYLFHVHASGFIRPLLDILIDPRIIKVGLNINGDVRKLMRDFGTKMNCLDSVQGVCDLRRLSKVTQVPPSSSLAGMVADELKFTLEKPMTTRCGNWEQVPLSVEQQLYASLDAYASYAVCMSILDRWMFSRGYAVRQDISYNDCRNVMYEMLQKNAFTYPSFTAALTEEHGAPFGGRTKSPRFPPQSCAPLPESARFSPFPIGPPRPHTNHARRSPYEAHDAGASVSPCGHASGPRIFSLANPANTETSTLPATTTAVRTLNAGQVCGVHVVRGAFFLSTEAHVFVRSTHSLPAPVLNYSPPAHGSCARHHCYAKWIKGHTVDSISKEHCISAAAVRSFLLDCIVKDRLPYRWVDFGVSDDDFDLVIAVYLHIFNIKFYDSSASLQDNRRRAISHSILPSDVVHTIEASGLSNPPEHWTVRLVAAHMRYCLGEDWLWRVKAPPILLNM